MPPWIEARELDELCARFPTLSRARVALALEAFWPDREAIDGALRQLAVTASADEAA